MICCLRHASLSRQSRLFPSTVLKGHACVILRWEPTGFLQSPYSPVLWNATRLISIVLFYMLRCCIIDPSRMHVPSRRQYFRCWSNQVSDAMSFDGFVELTLPITLLAQQIIKYARHLLVTPSTFETTLLSTITFTSWMGRNLYLSSLKATSFTILWKGHVLGFVDSAMFSFVFSTYRLSYNQCTSLTHSMLLFLMESSCL